LKAACALDGVEPLRTWQWTLQTVTRCGRPLQAVTGHSKAGNAEQRAGRRLPEERCAVLGVAALHVSQGVGPDAKVRGRQLQLRNLWAQEKPQRRAVRAQRSAERVVPAARAQARGGRAAARGGRGPGQGCDSGPASARSRPASARSRPASRRLAVPRAAPCRPAAASSASGRTARSCPAPPRSARSARTCRPPPPRTEGARRVPHPVLIGHAPAVSAAREHACSCAAVTKTAECAYAGHAGAFGGRAAVPRRAQAVAV